MANQIAKRSIYNPNKHVNIRVIGKLDFETGVQYPNCIPTQVEYNEILKKTFASNKYKNGHISSAMSKVWKEFDLLGINVSGHEEIFRMGKPESFPSNIY